MKRIVVLIDGTWNKEGNGASTNVAKLDPENKLFPKPLIRSVARDGTAQHVHYHDGVGNDGSWLARKLGGALGFGLKNIIQQAYNFVVEDYASGDEVYIFGFSRGAYAARALAGLIGASGIQRQQDSTTFDLAWQNYRSARGTQALQASAFHEDRSIRCVGVWDTVGSYGVPAGFGLEPLERYITLARLGFHDTHFGNHIAVGLHAVSIDEQRRPFVPTFWTAPKGHPPKGHVEQTWFPGVHCNVGGGYSNSGLSDLTLIWMLARVMALTKLEIDHQAAQLQLQPNIDGEVMNSASGIFAMDKLLPHHREILAADAIHHGIFSNRKDSSEINIDERVHWTAMDKRGRPCTVFGVPNTIYAPLNLPKVVPPEKIASMTPEERMLMPGLTSRAN